MLNCGEFKAIIYPKPGKSQTLIQFLKNHYSKGKILDNGYFIHFQINQDRSPELWINLQKTPHINKIFLNCDLLTAGG